MIEYEQQNSQTHLNPISAGAGHWFVSFDKTPIFYRRFQKNNLSKAIVLIVHGMGEHSGRYEEAGRYLSEFGFESIALDLRGFGRSGGKRAYVRRFSDFYKDLAALHQFLCRTNKEKPVFLLGHSLGGLISASYLAFSHFHSVKGLALCSPTFGLAIKIKWWQRILASFFSCWMPCLLQNNPVKAVQLMHDEALAEKYRTDPLVCRKVSVRLYSEFVRMMRRAREIAKRIEVPVLVLRAGLDSVVSKSGIENFYDFLGAKRKDLEIYPSSYHEILNDVEREKALCKIVSWMSQLL